VGVNVLDALKDLSITSPETEHPLFPLLEDEIALFEETQ